MERSGWDPEYSEVVRELMRKLMMFFEVYHTGTERSSGWGTPEEGVGSDFEENLHKKRLDEACYQGAWNQL